MDIRSIDPRSANLIIDTPIYRVEFWHHLPSHGAAQAMRSETFEVSGADVTDVLAWASGKSEAEESEFVLYVSIASRADVTLFRLAGSDLVDSTGPVGFGS